MASLAQRKVPPLALVPRDSLPREAAKQSPVHRKDRRLPQHRKAPTTAATHHDNVTAVENVTAAKDTDGEPSPTLHERQRHLGERFLAAMAQLSRLARVPLEVEAQTTTDEAISAPPTFQIAIQPEPAEAPVSPPRQRQSPVRKPPVPVCNVATEPLHAQLTFEISMLLPPPIDTRQSSLHSPIRRQKLRKRRRRRKTRLRRKREWHTSHATWTANVASDYAAEQEASAWRRGTAARHSNEMEQLAVRRAQGRLAINRAISLPVLGLSAPKSSAKADEVEDSESESDDDDANSEEDEEDNDSISSLAESETEPDAGDRDPGQTDDLHEDSVVAQQAMPLPSPKLEAETTTHLVQPPQSRMLHHQAAWISPELRAWLVASGLFATARVGKTAAGIHNGP